MPCLFHRLNPALTNLQVLANPPPWAKVTGESSRHDLLKKKRVGRILAPLSLVGFYLNVTHQKFSL